MKIDDENRDDGHPEFIPDEGLPAIAVLTLIYHDMAWLRSNNILTKPKKSHHARLGDEFSLPSDLSTTLSSPVVSKNHLIDYVIMDEKKILQRKLNYELMAMAEKVDLPFHRPAAKIRSSIIFDTRIEEKVPAEGSIDTSDIKNVGASEIVSIAMCLGADKNPFTGSNDDGIHLQVSDKDSITQHVYEKRAHSTNSLKFVAEPMQVNQVGTQPVTFIKPSTVISVPEHKAATHHQKRPIDSSQPFRRRIRLELFNADSFTPLFQCRMNLDQGTTINEVVERVKKLCAVDKVERLFSVNDGVRTEMKYMGDVELVHAVV